MGFAVTAAHLVFAVALLSAGSIAAGAYWQINGEIEEARREEATRATSAVHTAFIIPAQPVHDATNQHVDLQIKNNGTTVLKISAFTYLLDGVVRTSIASGYPIVAGAPGTDLLLPGETMTVRIENVAPAPTHYSAVAENGVSAYWRG